VTRGLRLLLALFMAYFGLGTFLPQIESALFLPRHLPPGFVTRLFVMGSITALLFAPAAVLIWGRQRPPAAVTPDGAARPLLVGGVLLRTALLAVVYVAVYLLAGYFIAYRNPNVLAYYNDADPGSFAAQVSRIWSGSPWFFGFQLVRGVLWVVFVLPLIAWLRGGRVEEALLTACLYTVWVVMLLAPNCAPELRMTHLVETTLEPPRCPVGAVPPAGPPGTYVPSVQPRLLQNHARDREDQDRDPETFPVAQDHVERDGDERHLRRNADSDVEGVARGVAVRPERRLREAHLL
jgi:hypothetical protein